MTTYSQHAAARCTAYHTQVLPVRQLHSLIHSITSALPSTVCPQVEVQRAQREHQTSEIMSLSLREQLAARQAELGELSTRHAALQAEAATASIALLESQASLAGLQMQHEGLQASATERAAQLEEVLADKCAELAEAERQVAATEEARATLDKGLQETAAREAAVAVQLKQLAGAHEQQMSKLRQEAEARRTADDELAAVRAGLQVRGGRCVGEVVMACWRRTNSASLPCINSSLPIDLGAGDPAAAGGVGHCVCQQFCAPHCCRGLARNRTHQHGPAGEL